MGMVKILQKTELMSPQQNYGASPTARIRELRPLITPAIHPFSKLRGILAFFYKNVPIAWKFFTGFMLLCMRIRKFSCND